MEIRFRVSLRRFASSASIRRTSGSESSGSFRSRSRSSGRGVEVFAARAEGVAEVVFNRTGANVVC